MSRIPAPCWSLGVASGGDFVKDKWPGPASSPELRIPGMWYHESAMFPQERPSAYYPPLVIDGNIQTSGWGPQAAEPRFQFICSKWNPGNRRVEAGPLWTGKKRLWATVPWSILGHDRGHLNGLVISAQKYLQTTALRESSWSPTKACHLTSKWITTEGWYFT